MPLFRVQELGSKVCVGVAPEAPRALKALQPWARRRTPGGRISASAANRQTNSPRWLPGNTTASGLNKIGTARPHWVDDAKLVEGSTETGKRKRARQRGGCDRDCRHGSSILRQTRPVVQSAPLISSVMRVRTTILTVQSLRVRTFSSPPPTAPALQIVAELARQGITCEVALTARNEAALDPRNFRSVL
jgi:hypothetical protein